MTIRPHIALDPSSLPRPSARVARVAELLDCAPGDVYRLVNDGDLEAHGKGIRGVRVYLDSVKAYQDRHYKVPSPKARKLIHRPKAPSKASSAAHRASVAGLAAKGLI